jgi:hypothetical protein
VKKPNIYILLGTAFLILTWLFIGFFRDDEFYEPELFVKYRPKFKVNFYSPIGMQDFKISDLPPDKKAEEIAFQEFVRDRYKTNRKLWYLSFLIIQLILTFFSFGILKIRRHQANRKWQLPVHFAINIAITTFAIAFIFFFDNALAVMGGGVLIMTINYFILVLLIRLKIKPQNIIN